MIPERAALTTLRAQLGYAEVALSNKEGDVLNAEAKLDKARNEEREARQRWLDYLDAIRVLEEAGYGSE